MRLHFLSQSQSPCQKITAKRHIFLAISFNLCISPFQLNLCIRKSSLYKSCFRPHNLFCPLSVTTGNLVIMRHTFIHLGKLTFQLSRTAVKHHQHRRRSKGPAAVVLNTDGRSGHLAAGSSMQLTHSSDIIIAKETHN